MPAEVATEMLIRGRLTNWQRKRCMEARQKVFGSGVPLLRQNSKLVFDADFSSPEAGNKLDRRHSRMPIDRLSRLVRRSIRARRRVQSAYAKLAGDESKKAVQLRRMLDLAAEHHGAVQESAQLTINARLYLAKLRLGTVI